MLYILETFNWFGEILVDYRRRKKKLSKSNGLEKKKKRERKKKRKLTDGLP